MHHHHHHCMDREDGPLLRAAHCGDPGAEGLDTASPRSPAAAGTAAAHTLQEEERSTAGLAPTLQAQAPPLAAAAPKAACMAPRRELAGHCCTRDYRHSLPLLHNRNPAEEEGRQSFRSMREGESAMAPDAMACC